MFGAYALMIGAAALAAPTLTSANYTIIDTAGGGQAIVLTGTNLASASAVNVSGGASVAPTSSTATTVTFPAPARTAGAATISVTTPGGTSNTLAVEYWTPAQIANVDAYCDSNKGVTQASGAVSAWLDQALGRNFTQATGANKPSQVASVFGSLPAIRFTPQQWLALAAESVTAAGASKFIVAKWTATRAVATGNDLVPLCAIGSTLGGWGGFGASAGALGASAYTNLLQTRGSGLNDGNTRLVGVTYDAATDMKFYAGTAQQGATASLPPIDNRNAYDAIGNGAQLGDGFNGDIGAAVVVKGVIASGDHTKLYAWSRQRFGAA